MYDGHKWRAGGDLFQRTAGSVGSDESRWQKADVDWLRERFAGPSLTTSDFAQLGSSEQINGDPPESISHRKGPIRLIDKIAPVHDLTSTA